MTKTETKPTEAAQEELKAVDRTAQLIEMLATMQQQVAEQNVRIAELLEKQGKTLENVYAKPPAGVTVVSEPSFEGERGAQGSGDTGPVPIDVPGLPPGTRLPGGNWVPWRKEDLNPDDMVAFVPYPVPGMVWPYPDEEGRQKIRLSVQGLHCWVTCGEYQSINKFFYNAYESSFNEWRKLEKFKREGGFGPWIGGDHGRNTWLYDPEAISFYMDEDGRPANIDTSIWTRSPLTGSPASAELNPLNQ